MNRVTSEPTGGGAVTRGSLTAGAVSCPAVCLECPSKWRCWVHYISISITARGGGREVEKASLLAVGVSLAHRLLTTDTHTWGSQPHLKGPRAVVSRPLWSRAAWDNKPAG